MGTDRVVTLVGADGSRHVLACSAEPYQLARNSTIMGTAPYALSSRRRGPTLPGEVLDSVHAEPRTFAVPIQIEGTTEQDLDRHIAALGSVLSPDIGPCRIVWTRPDGTSRELTGWHLDGGSGIEWRDHLQRQHRAQLIFRALFPYWRGVDTAQGESTGTFADASLAHSNPLALFNAGDVRTWPQITIAGPCQNIEAVNISTGQVWRIIEQLGPADRVRLECDPRSIGVWFNDDFRHNVLDPQACELWPLLPGVNLIVLRAINPTGLGTWQIRWPLLYETC